jgi:hypothetical protein
MRVAIISIVVASALSVAAPVFAQAAAEPAAAAPVKLGALVVDSEGRRIGRVERVNKDKDGTPTTVSIISGSKFVYVPVSSLTQGEKSYATSLARAEILAGK